ncbi:MAG: RDD family protein, partial [Leadbetterella sp.]
RSIGKYLLKIKVIGIDGNPPTIYQCAIRWVFLLTDVYFFLPFISIHEGFAAIWIFSPFVGLGIALKTKYGQRFGDMAAQTLIVNENEKSYSINETIYAYSYNINDNYEVMFPEVSKLSDKDMTIVKTLLERSHDNYNFELANRVANRVKEILEIDTRLDDYKFLVKILQDYNYLTMK